MVSISFRKTEDDPDYDVPVIVYPGDTGLEGNHGQVRFVHAVQPVSFDGLAVQNVRERAGCGS